MEQALLLLEYLGSLDPHGFREFRLLGPRIDRRFIAMDAPRRSLAKLLQSVFKRADEGYDAYFGMNPRRRLSGVRESIYSSVAAVLDVDDFSRWDRINDLARLGIAPCAIVASGSGAHVYYAFTAAIPPSEGEDLGARLCAFVGCDPSYDACRCPRIPGTMNWRHYKTTWLSAFDPDARTEPDAIRRLPAVTRPKRERPEPFPWQDVEPREPNSVRALPLTLRRLLENYGTVDRSRIDAAVAIACKRAYLSNRMITSLLIWPPRSKLREKFQREGRRSAEYYLTRTLRFAERAVHAERRGRDARVTHASNSR